MQFITIVEPWEWHLIKEFLSLISSDTLIVEALLNKCLADKQK